MFSKQVIEQYTHFGIIDVKLKMLNHTAYCIVI